MTLLYCGFNVTLSQVWIDKGFSPCFLRTVQCGVLASLMLIFGTFELIMYYRFGTRVEQTLKEYRFFYVVQIGSMVILAFIPCVEVVLTATVFGDHLDGYMILYMLASLYIWIQSLVLVRTERNYDLPTTPVHGHSLVLLIFWTLALMFDVLEFVDVSAKSWVEDLTHVRTATLFALLVLHFICVLITFVTGIKAPGVATLQRRYISVYKKLPDERLKKGGRSNYGATDFRASDSSEQHQMSLDLDLPTSLELLETQLRTGEAQRQFDNVPKQKSGLKTAAAGMAENRGKNRHLNILPYDVTRVILQESPEGRTYINANRMTIFLPSSEVGRTFIATQAPLPETVGDFWQMVYENLSGVIVTLCNLMEKGTSACVQYWPNKNECSEHGRLVVTCTDETIPQATYFAKKPFVVREFSIFNLETQQELSVTQFHLIAWSPDPHDNAAVRRAGFKPSELADFIQEIRNFEYISSGPEIIHCSNGIDRTGAYILAELGRQLIDDDHPIRPIDLLQQMRTQRPAMITKYADYEFACKAILTMYQRVAKQLGYPLLKDKY